MRQLCKLIEIVCHTRKVADYGCILSRMFGYYSGIKGCVSYILGKRAVGILASVA